MQNIRKKYEEQVEINWMVMAVQADQGYTL